MDGYLDSYDTLVLIHAYLLSFLFLFWFVLKNPGLCQLQDWVQSWKPSKSARHHRLLSRSKHFGRWGESKICCSKLWEVCRSDGQVSLKKRRRRNKNCHFSFRYPSTDAELCFRWCLMWDRRVEVSPLYVKLGRYAVRNIGERYGGRALLYSMRSNNLNDIAKMMSLIASRAKPQEEELVITKVVLQYLNFHCRTAPMFAAYAKGKECV